MVQETEVNDIVMLAQLDPDRLLNRDKQDLVQLITILSQDLLSYRNRCYGVNEVAEMFDRSTDWVYSALSRPQTTLQTEIFNAAKRDGRLVSFSAIELVRIKQDFLNNCDE